MKWLSHLAVLLTSNKRHQIVWIELRNLTLHDSFAMRHKYLLAISSCYRNANIWSTNSILTRTAMSLVSGLQIACKFSPSLWIESAFLLYLPNLTLCCEVKHKYTPENQVKNPIYHTGNIKFIIQPTEWNVMRSYTWEDDHSSRWVGATTRSKRFTTLRYTICCVDGQLGNSRGMTCGHPYAIYIFENSCVMREKIRISEWEIHGVY